MSGGGARDWMWSEALEMLARVERLQRQSFQPRPPERAKPVCWEPPVDIFETARELVVIVALPGVDPRAVNVTVENGVLEIYAERSPPPALGMATIHRLELPQGCFRRRLLLPNGAYGDIQSGMENGCLVITLRKFQGR
jgi:HSP20 family molecular chaperone IbpA